MPLFDPIQRVEVRERFENESSFSYLNTSARPGICAIRDLLESWFNHLPEPAQADIRGRFRCNDEVQYQSAYFELFWHELLRSSGYEVEVHPTLVGVSTNPDFLAKRRGVPQFYLEATLAMPPGDPRAYRRFAELHDTLNRLNSPDFFLEIQYRGTPSGNVRGRVLRDRLTTWLCALNYAEIARLYECGDYGAVPTLTVLEHGLTLTFTPMPKGPEFRGQPGARPVATVMPLDMREVRTHDDIRSAVEGKAGKYGALNLPLVVAVNILDDFCDNTDLWNALFGEEQVVVTRQADGQYRHDWGARARNGAWYGRAGPRNTLVSAVSIAHQLAPSNLTTHAVDLVHNPWALHPLVPELLPLPQRSIFLCDGHINRREGASAADTLGIPTPWPIPDE